MAKFSNTYGECEITQMPGNKQICISHGVQTFPEYRGKGHGKENMRLRLLRMKSMGYSFVLATVRHDNNAEIALMMKFGWIALRLLETKPGNHVWLMIFDLRDYNG